MSSYTTHSLSLTPSYLVVRLIQKLGDSLLDLLNSISHMDDIQDVSAQSDLSASGGGGSSDRSDPARLPTWVIVVSLFVFLSILDSTLSSSKRPRMQSVKN